MLDNSEQNAEIIPKIIDYFDSIIYIIIKENTMDYIKRIIDKDLDLRSKAFNAIQIVGPKGCGKTRTAKERCKTIIEFEDEEKRNSYLLLADTSPSSFFLNQKPILFDEWQDAPKIWGAVRKNCDDNPEDSGSYYLTGSTSKEVDTPHTGTLRISTVEMSPMSLYESGDSNGDISLSELFDKKQITKMSESKLDIPELIYVCCRGGWPRSLYPTDKNAKLLIAKDSYKQIINKDISSIDGIKRNPDWAAAIIKSYARNIGTLCKKSILYNDAKGTFGFSEDTYDTYLDKLKELYVVKDYYAWCPQIRSEKSLRAPKKHMFIDPSVAIAALGLKPEYFLQDFDLFGHIFESLVYRDLNVYSMALGGSLSHYHDTYDLEVDAVLHLEDGRYALIEIKLGNKDIKKGIANLLKVKELIIEHNKKSDVLKMREPDLLMVITGHGISYESEEGVFVIPIGCLKD